MGAADLGAADRPLWVLGHRVRLFETHGDYAMLEITTHPGVPGPPPHHHDDAAEFFYIVSGALEVFADGRWSRLDTGESRALPPGVVHTFRNPGSEPTVWITGFSPSGFERFFRDFGVPAENAEISDEAFARSVAPPVIDRVGREAADYGMIIAAAPIA